MSEVVRIDLDSVKKHRNAQEWRWVNRATCGDVSSTGDGGNIVKVAKALIERGHAPEVEVKCYRGNMLCLSGASLAIWAAGKFGRGEQPAQLAGAGNE